MDRRHVRRGSSKRGMTQPLPVPDERDAHLVIRVGLMRVTAMHHIGFERSKGLDGTLRCLWPGHIEVLHG